MLNQKCTFQCLSKVLFMVVSFERVNCGGWRVLDATTQVPTKQKPLTKLFKNIVNSSRSNLWYGLGPNVRCVVSNLWPDLSFHNSLLFSYYCTSTCTSAWESSSLCLIFLSFKPTHSSSAPNSCLLPHLTFFFPFVFSCQYCIGASYLVLLP